MAQSFRVVPITGKGLGVVATRPIKRGQLLISEKPLLTSPGKLSLSSPSPEAAHAYFAQQVAALEPEQQSLFWSLSDWRAEQAGTAKTAYQVFRSNGLPQGHGRVAEAASVFPTLCRFNHSCAPNCHHSWDPDRGEEVMYTVADVSPGQELQNSYIELFASREARRAVLLEKFGCICTCQACSAQGDSLAQSDRRREQLRLLDAAVRSKAVIRPAQALQAADELLALIEEEGIADTYLKARVCRIAVDICTTNSGFGSAQEYAQAALTNFTICEGADGIRAKEMQAELASLN